MYKKKVPYNNTVKVKVKLRGGWVHGASPSIYLYIFFVL